jgi:N-hydroxyarylamine O-acetyltransferase
MGGRRAQSSQDPLIQGYLARIGAAPGRGSDLPRLTALVRAHLEAVPFENLDIHRGVRLSLERSALYDKIVARGRGGFCYELNGLFAWLLEELGFAVSRHGARVIGQGGELGPPLDHLALAVAGDDFAPHLVDVGFGEGPRRPMPLEAGAEIEELGLRWELEAAGDELRLRLADSAGPAAPGSGYLLERRPRPLSDFEDMCRFHQSSPSSPFVRGRLCSLATAVGRISLTGTQLREWIAGEPPRGSEITSEAAFHAALAERFAIRGLGR